MPHSRVHDIKISQKERLLFREITNAFWQLTLDDSRLRGIIVTRIKLSADRGLCTIYCYMPEGLEVFREKLEIIKLYKPSMRKALSDTIEARHTPELRFIFDDTYQKQEEFEQLMENIKKEDES